MSRFAAFAAALSLLVLGGLVGALGSHLFHAHHPPPAEPPPLLGGHAVHRLERHLQLTPEQSLELAAILQRARDEGETLRADVEPRLHAILIGAMEEIDAMLTPEQRRRFRRVRERWAAEHRFGERWPGWRERGGRRWGDERRPGPPPHHRHPGEPAPGDAEDGS